MSETANRATLDLLYNVSRELTSDLDLRTVLARSISLSSKYIGAERASVIVVDDHQQPVEGAIIVHDRLIPHTADLLRGTLERGLAGWVFRTRQPALINNSSLDERWEQRPDDAAERSGPKSALCVPILARDQVVGVITIVHPSPNFFTPEHLALLGAIADQAGSAIYNARLHSELQAAYHRYQELFEDSIDPIFITAWDRHILEANRQAAVLSGRTERAELRGLRMDGLLSLDSSWLNAQDSDLLAGRMVDRECELKTQGGGQVPVEAYLRKVKIDGQDALQWILRDLSERKALDALRDTLTEFIIHDLRAPLSNIISSLEFLNMFLPANDGENLHEVLSIASRSAQRMFRLIMSLLDINRLEKGQTITERALDDPVRLIDEALDAVRPTSEGKRQSLKVEAEKNLPQIWVDHDMIARVLINLIDNAVKYTPNEGSILVKARRAGRQIEFSVKDSGPGIPAEEKEAVFNRFYRVKAEQKKTGFGLGLSFCKLAVEAHGGKIWVEGAPGEGSCFVFQLPLVAAPGEKN